jgi:hypothetical protein
VATEQFLRAATFVRNSGIPILGKCRKIGFLPKCKKEDIKLFTIVLDKYTISKRTLLSLETTPKNLKLKIKLCDE